MTDKQLISEVVRDGAPLTAYIEEGDAGRLSLDAPTVAT